MNLQKRFLEITRKWIIANTLMMSLLMIAVGFILILLGQRLNAGVWRSLLESFGVLFSSVFFISLLYEKFLAEKHFFQFSSIMGSKLEEMNNVQSACTRLGIREIFETRNEFERKYPMLSLFSRTKPGSRILVVGRSMFHFFNKADAIKKALEKGSNIQVACISPNEITEILSKVSFLRRPDIQAPLEEVYDLINWAQERKPLGSFELRIHNAPFPDSILYVELEDRNFLAWDMTFGRDLNQKRVFIIEPGQGNLGSDLLGRYQTVWNMASSCVKLDPNGALTVNKLQDFIRSESE